jgi:hypothetical protein
MDRFAQNGTGIFNRQFVTVSEQVNPAAPYPELFMTISASGITATDPYGNVLSPSPSPSPFPSPSLPPPSLIEYLLKQNLVVSVYLNQQIYANGTLNLTSSDPLAGTFFVANALVVEADILIFFFFFSFYFF